MHASLLRSGQFSLLGPGKNQWLSLSLKATCVVLGVLSVLLGVRLILVAGVQGLLGKVLARLSESMDYGGNDTLAWRDVTIRTVLHA